MSVYPPSRGSGGSNSDEVKKTSLNCAPFHFQKSSISQNATLPPIHPSSGSGGGNSDVVKKTSLNCAPVYFRKLSIFQNATLPHNNPTPHPKKKSLQTLVQVGQGLFIHFHCWWCGCPKYVLKTGKRNCLTINTLSRPSASIKLAVQIKQ